MSEWKKVKLGDVCQIIDGDRGKNYPKNHEFFESGYCLFLNTGNVTKEGFSFANNQFITKEKDELLRKGKIQRGDLILTTRGTVGNIAYYTNHIKYENVRINSGMVILRVNKENVDASFLYQLVRSKESRTYINSFCTGSAQPQLPIKNLSQICFEIPSLSTQHRIATILSRYDSLIENYQKQIKLLEEAAQRLYKEWFVDLHFPGHENTKIVNGVPEGLEKKPVKTIVELQSGYAFKSSDFASDGIYKIVTIKNVKDGAFDGENVSKIASIPEKMPKHCILEDGDILLSLTGNVGRVCIVVGKNYLLNQRVAKLKSIFKAYTYCLFRSRDMFIDVNNLANGAAQQNVSPIKIGEMKILIPENKLLNEFEKESSNYISGVIAFQSQIRLLTEARDRLLPKLMSGEITI